MGCLFPGIDTPVRSARKSTRANKTGGNGETVCAEIHPGLKKRGMTIAHVNIVTLPGNLLMLMFYSRIQHLMCLQLPSLIWTLLSLTVRYVLQGIFATEKIEIGTGEVVLCLSRVNSLASGE